MATRVGWEKRKRNFGLNSTLGRIEKFDGLTGTGQVTGSG